MKQLEINKSVAQVERLKVHKHGAQYAAMMVVCAVAFALESRCGADDDLQVRSSWSEPAAIELWERLDAWLGDLDLDARQLDAISDLESELLAAESAEQAFDSMMAIVSYVDREAMDLVQTCQIGSAASVDSLDDLAKRRKWPPIVTANLRLLLGKSLAIGQLYDEARAHLRQIEIEAVADPATLLFYLGAAQYRLRDRDQALDTLAKLLERGEEIPSRYATIARLMEAELKATKPDSLGDIAQIMDSIRVRLDHGRAGKRVRVEEQEVIDKLEKMIEKLEQQLRQMQAAQAGQMGGNMPSNPMQDSMPGGGRGPGDVDPKALGERTDWGDLPPKQREAALQQIGEEFPSHYRNVIEEYFRQLAKEGG